MSKTRNSKIEVFFRDEKKGKNIFLTNLLKVSPKLIDKDSTIDSKEKRRNLRIYIKKKNFKKALTNFLTISPKLMDKDPTIDSKERWRNLRMYKKRILRKITKMTLI